MAYQYKGPSLAAGGTLVKGNGRRTASKQAASKQAVNPPHQEPKAKSMFTPEEWAERLAPGWDERGWHGGGMCEIRKTQKSRPSKGNTRTGRQAHPSLLRVTK